MRTRRTCWARDLAQRQLPDSPFSPPHACAACVSGIVSMLMYWGGRFYSPLLFSSYKGLSKKDKREWDVRQVPSRDLEAHSARMHAGGCALHGTHPRIPMHACTQVRLHAALAPLRVVRLHRPVAERLLLCGRAGAQHPSDQPSQLHRARDLLWILRGRHVRLPQVSRECRKGSTNTEGSSEREGDPHPFPCLAIRCPSNLLAPHTALLLPLPLRRWEAPRWWRTT